MSNAMTGRRLLIVSGVRWDLLWQRHQALAVAAVKSGWEVDFVDPPIRGLKHALGSARGRLSGARHVAVSNPVPEGVRLIKVPPKVAVVGPRSTASYLRSRLGQGYALCLLYLPDIELVKLAEELSVNVVYDEVVDWATAPSYWYPPASSFRADARMMHAPWKRITDNETVSERCQQRGADSTVVSPAADQAFLEYRWSTPTAGAPAMYFGSVRPAEVDIKLLCELATAGCPVRVVGPVKERETDAVLRRHGVQVSGPVSPFELPAVIATASLLLLPYASPRGATVTPAKLWNCLATNRTIWTRGLTIGSEIVGEFEPISPDNHQAVRDILDAVQGPEVRTPLLATWRDRWMQVENIAGLSGS